MHILIIGAAGMVGAQAHRAAGEGRRARRASRSTEVDAARRRRAAGARERAASRSRPMPSDSRRARRGRKLVAERPDIDLPSRRDRLGRGRGRFRQGLPHQSRRHALPVRRDPQGRRRLQAAPRLHLVDRGLRRAVPGGDRRRVLHDAADQLRHAEGDRRAAARRLHAARLLRRHRHPPADDLRAAGQAQQGGLGLLLRHHPRAARRRRRRCCRSPRTCATGTPPRARRSSFLIHAAALDTAACRPPAQPHHAGRVGDRRRADRGAAQGRRRQGRVTRIRREPDPAIIKIVEGWPRNFDAERAPSARLQGREELRGDHPRPYRGRARRQVGGLSRIPAVIDPPDSSPSLNDAAASPTLMDRPSPIMQACWMEAMETLPWTRRRSTRRRPN